MIVISSGWGLTSGALPAYYAMQGKPFDIVTCILPNEDPDVFRLIHETEKLFGIKVKDAGIGKTPMQVFDEYGFLANTYIDICSAKLKRQPMKTYILANYSPLDTTLALGITGDELNRSLSIRKNWNKTGFQTEFPFLDFYWSRKEWLDFFEAIYGFIPRLYLMGFAHNNCGGACVKAGLRQWAKLLWFLPDVYREWEQGEIAWQQKHNKANTILKRSVKGVNIPISLKELREELEGKWKGLLPFMTPYEQIIEYEKQDLGDLEDTPACTFCDAMAYDEDKP